MKITLFGSGYVGLVTGACFAEAGNEVLCIDIDENKINNLKSGIIPIYENGLEELIKKNYKLKKIDFDTDSKRGIEFGQAIFSAVGTPCGEDHKADLRFVKEVAKTFGKYLNEYKIFINKSTIPVGTGDICKNIIQEELKKRNTDIDFDIVSNPEFLKEGTAIKDFMYPSRIICGVENEKSKNLMKDIYKFFEKEDSPLVFTDIKSSEIIKYASNAFLATKISFINEIANFSEIVGGNINEISKGIGLDARIGNKFLNAGIGYGGSCFPKDIKALIATGKEYNYDFKIIKATEEVNQKQKIILNKKLKKYIPHLEGKTISLWGLSYKPKTDDIRDAPSIEIINELLKDGAFKINIYDPICNENVKNIFKNNDKINFYLDKYDTLKDSDGLLLVTEWDEFKNVDFQKLKNNMKGNIIIDGRNIWNKHEFEKNGLIYEGIGK